MEVLTIVSVRFCNGPLGFENENREKQIRLEQLCARTARSHISTAMHYETFGNEIKRDSYLICTFWCRTMSSYWWTVAWKSWWEYSHWIRTRMWLESSRNSLIPSLTWDEGETGKKLTGIDCVVILAKISQACRMSHEFCPEIPLWFVEKVLRVRRDLTGYWFRKGREEIGNGV